MTDSPQRAYRANCPNCGAPVEFASAASASAVCGFCRSTLVRDGEALRRIGVSAELFDDHSPLQLGVGGKLQGVAFTLVGRLQYGYTLDPQAAAAPAPPPKGAAGATGEAGPRLDGSWNEWHALFDNQRSAWLSEDNGAYVIGFDVDTPPDAPPLDEVQAGETRQIGGQRWSVASVVRARLIAAQGELPQPPRLEGEFTVVDLRNALGEVGTLDGSDPARIHWSVGRTVALSELALSGLRELGEKQLGGRAIECPSCGAALEVKLASTKSIVCHQCSAVVDVSAGVGGDLAHYAQSNAGRMPQIPLGRSGTLALGAPPVPWQVVGYVERRDLPEPGDDEESTAWREYLLYNRLEGFAFLVDAEDGWSWVKPITGAPVMRGDKADWNGVSYQKRYSYAAKVTRVLGEFYWRLKRDERAQVTDYDGIGKAHDKRLSREQVGQEVTWSAGATIDADKIVTAFGLPDGARLSLKRDVAPFSADHSLRNIVRIVLVLLVVGFALAQCSDDGCDDVRSTFGASSNEYQQCLARSSSGGIRSSGGSFGGWSSGGGHK